MDLDPCPGAALIGVTYPMYLHVTPVTCGGCGRLIRAAFWTGKAHACGPCYRKGEAR